MTAETLLALAEELAIRSAWQEALCAQTCSTAAQQLAA